MRGVRRGRRGNLAGRVTPVRTALAGLARAVTDRFMRWRGHPPQEAGVREPRRPRPTLPAASVALAEPRTQVRRRALPWTWLRVNGSTERWRA
jgi:hypothetical protein